ncbi:helix-turn-helix domain-containing protein [Amycolatopsis ultiminotia]|uniref:Helix-turn-helix domain-containing protein n=1 Tax=Amycolatopsis ultiminotia TaxID=543629 RepID=A0ABP6XJ30_9PSEU
MRPQRHPEPSEITLTGVLTALSDPIRLSIVCSLSDGQEHGVGEFQHFPVVRSTLSHHAKVLRASGITFTRTVGTHCYLSLRSELEELFPGLIAKVVALADPEQIAKSMAVRP